MAQPLRTIGQALNIIKPEFPDITVSKIRYLEKLGLVMPERAPSGFRRYSDADIERLRYVLISQRDNFLPLRVIRSNLEMMDRGLVPPTIDQTPQPPEPSASLPSSPMPTDSTDQPPAPTPGPAAPPTAAAARKRPIRVTRRQLINMSGIDEPTLIEMERQQIISPRYGGYYGREALTIALATAKLKPYGFTARHMRAIFQAAEREAGMVEQAILPLLRRGSNDAIQAAREITQLVVHTHAAMMHVILER